MYCQSIRPSVVANAGDVFKTGSFSIEWTLGELATETISSPSHKITQGFHQGNLIISGVDNPKISGLNLFPNPIESLLNIQNITDQILTYDLIDLSGSLIQSGKIQIGMNSLDLATLISGKYILNVVSDKSVSSYKIEKIK